MSKKPLSFGATMLASALGVVIVSAVGGLLSLIMMISTIVSLNNMSKSDIALVKSGTFLTVDLDHISGDRTGTGLMQSFNTDGKTVGLLDAVAAINAAADDNNVKGLLLKGDGSMSSASLEELRAAINGFSDSGKPVIAYATGFSQGGYYLCTAADKVCLHPEGMVDFRGMGGEVIYYKDLLDKLGVEMQLIRPESCAYKSAGEVYTLSHMSPANREQIRAYISSVWRTMVEDISASRGIATAELNKIADNLSGLLASDACANGLVDTMCFEEDLRAMLREQYDGKHLMGLEKYANNIRQADTKAKKKGPAIAVIYAEGEVVDGTSKGYNTAVYGDDIVKSLREATEDDDVKAIVLRVNSPGGQVTASENMTHAVMAAKAKKPVIVSMGDLAASAGYEMSCMADVIVAQPMTITGSIGVFAAYPNAGKLMSKKLGLNADTVSTNRNATSMGLLRPLSPEAMALMTRNVEEFYKTFVGRVAEGRHMSYDAVHQIARGRVWTGADAIGIGLVDTLGGFDLAMKIAAEKAGLDSYRVKNYPEEKDTWKQLSEMLNGGDDSDIDLHSKLRLALMWRVRSSEFGVRSFSSEFGTWSSEVSPAYQWRSELRQLAEVEGLQARLPFVIIY